MSLLSQADRPESSGMSRGQASAMISSGRDGVGEEIGEHLDKESRFECNLHPETNWCGITKTQLLSPRLNQ